MSDNVRFYSSQYLANMKDKYDNIPEIFMTMGNRGSGKTFDIVNTQLLKNFFEKGDKFALLTRLKGDLGGVAEGVLKEVLNIKYPGYYEKEVMDTTKKFSRIYLVSKGENEEGEEVVSEEHCGYVLPLHGARGLKPYSSTFVDVARMFMDEFQAIDYNSDEVGEFISIHQTVARGGGKAVRYVPVFMASNAINITNPYFVQLGILQQLQPDTKKLRGDGWVLEIFLNKDVQKAQEQSAFNRAFASHNEVQASNNNMWLLGNESCICKPDKDWGRSTYYCTIKDENNTYGVRYYPTVGLYYINYSIDETCPYEYNMSMNGELNIPLLKKSSMFKEIRENFSMGQLRMVSPQIKEMVLKTFV